MTDNQDSVTAGAVQPPTDRPLTAGDVPLLREGDVLRARNGKLLSYAYTDKKGWAFCDGFGAPIDRDAHTLESFTFVSRAASEVSDLARLIAAHLPTAHCPDTYCIPVTMTAGELRAIHMALSSRPATSAASDGLEPTTAREVLDLLASDDPVITTMRKADLNDSRLITLAYALIAHRKDAALASPPVSERERELEGALRYVVGLLPGLAGAQHQPDNAVYTVMAAKSEIMEARRLRDTLTAQPAGEGK